jgi:hypothetical protein
MNPAGCRSARECGLSPGQAIKEKPVAALLELGDDQTACFVRGLLLENNDLKAENSRLREVNAELAKRPAPKKRTAAQREVMRIAQRARHAKRRVRAPKAAFFVHEELPTPEALAQAMATRNTRLNGSYGLAE